MAILNQKRILNLIPKVSAPVTIHVSQGDVGTEIEFTLVKGDELFVDTGNLTASVHGVREDGANFGAFTCTLSGSKVIFPLHSEMTAVKGSAIAEVVLVDNGGNKVGSANFGILVEESVFPLGVTYDNDVSVYESILAYVQTNAAQLVEDYTSKINAEVTARQNAVSGIQNNLNSEISERTSADALINTRIDEIIAPSGEAPNPAEITDARIGEDGVTYPTLGDAIRTQLTNLILKTPWFHGALNNGDDLNDLYETGWKYSGNTAVLLNAPYTEGGRRIVFTFGDRNPTATELRYQFYYNASRGQMAFRIFLTGGYGWQPWRKISSIVDLKHMVSGDYTDTFISGFYWASDGTKTELGNGSCTPPIYVPKGWGLLVSSGIGNSGCSICEVTEADAFVTAVNIGTSYKYLHVSDGDKYYSVSNVSTVDSDITLSVHVIEPEAIKAIERAEFNKTNYLIDYGCKAGRYSDDGTYAASSSYTIWKTSKIKVKAGETISAMLAGGNTVRLINIIYNDGTSEYVLGSTSSALRRYVLTAAKDGYAYVSSYNEDGPYFVVTSPLDGQKNKFTSRIFKKVVCCGDSYTAGWISKNGEGVRNNPSFNLPHYMSILTGNEWIDCGASGTTSITWQTNVNGYNAAKSAGKAQAYIIGLGINDSVDNIGTPADIGTDAQTYYGGISQIIDKLSLISPDAIIFVETNPDVNNFTGTAQKNAALRVIVDTMNANYNVYLLDLEKYTDYYKTPMILNDSLDGHFTALGYEQFAEIFNSIFSEYINNHFNDFQRVAFIPFDSDNIDAIDCILSDSNAVTITSTVSSYNTYGKYLQANGKVYFKLALLVTTDISSTISNMYLNLPVPEDGTIFFNKTVNDLQHKSHIRYVNSKWVLGGIVDTIPVGRYLLFYGQYIVS